MAANERSSGFKRILLRLDEDTRRKYCCLAVEEDLQHVKSQMEACEAAMMEVKQVQDAMLKLHASQRATVSSELLAELETLQRQLEPCLNKLCKGSVDMTKGHAITRDTQQAKTLSRQILRAQELGIAVDGMRKLQRLMPILTEADEKQKKWWKKHVLKVVAHAVVLLESDGKQDKLVHRLEKVLKKIKDKCPGLEMWHSDVQTQIAAKTNLKSTLKSKSKKKRKIALSSDDEMTASRSTRSSKAKCGSNEKIKGLAVEKVQALLQRCSREVRTLRDKFELGAYDVNLSRMVTIVDSLWPEFEHSDVVVLTTALFTLVETVEKVVHQTKRRDRLVCLGSVLRVVLGSSRLQLTTQQKTMIEEYANNCRQSVEQLNRQEENLEQVSAQKSSPATTSSRASNATKRAASKALTRSHVRFS